MSPAIKSLFQEHTLKYVEVVEDCAVTSDLRGKQKLHLGIQALITARSLEGTMYNKLLLPTKRRFVWRQSHFHTL